jgi:hypothetical protein
VRAVLKGMVVCCLLYAVCGEDSDTGV